MYDDIRAYPGAVSITVSGTAASAATMLCMAADHLDMTPGSLFMIHDPSMMAFGNEHDLEDSIAILRACKESILNMYERRIRVSRNDAADMMTASTWMDANAAFDRGFVDAIVEQSAKYPVNSAENRVVDADLAKEKVNAWLERKKKPVVSPGCSNNDTDSPDRRTDYEEEETEPQESCNAESQEMEPQEPCNAESQETEPQEPCNTELHETEPKPTDEAISDETDVSEITPDPVRKKVVQTDSRLENLRY